MTAEYYLFELGLSVVKREDGFWYKRDRDAHEWIMDLSWDRRYYDAQYTVIEIEYDEESEQIVSGRDIDGFGLPAMEGSSNDILEGWELPNDLYPHD